MNEFCVLTQEAMEQDISVLIIEDEALWSQSLAASLDDFGFKVAGTAADFESAVMALNRLDYDLVLLDIYLHGRDSGIELGKMVHSVYKKPFIFITASFGSETEAAAIAAGPSAYLIKPVHPASLFVTIQAAIRNYTEKKPAAAPAEAAADEAFFVKQGDKLKKLSWRDIVCLRSEKNYTALVNATDGATYFIRSTLPKTLRFIVPAALQKNFVQINRSEAVQISFITELVRNEVHTASGTFAVTDTHLKELKEKLRIIS